MNQETVIADLEAQARAAGVSIAALCRRAGIHPVTFSRWKRSDRNPEPRGAPIKSIGLLYDALAEMTQPQRRRAGGRR